MKVGLSASELFVLEQFIPIVFLSPATDKVSAPGTSEE